MPRTNFDDLLKAGVHFGHLKRKWNPHMAPYIFMERNGIHIIDLYKTQAKIDEAAAALKQIAHSGKKVLFVATKKQAKDVVSEVVKNVSMPYVTERWPGGMLTNFATIRKAVRKMSAIDRQMASSNFGSISELNRLPSALFVVDIIKEHIAVAEAKKLGIPTFAIVDTNADPNQVDFPIPANDDAAKSIELIVKAMCDAIQEGLDERKLDKEKREDDDAVETDEENENDSDNFEDENGEDANDDDKRQRRRRSAK